jgi:NitT/TauT family transport system ATP-binding protein
MPEASRQASVPPPSGRTGGSGIRITRLCKTYTSGGQDTEALRDIDLDIRAGEFIVLLGRSGCGKSTLLRMLGGLLSATGGSIAFGDKPLYDARNRIDDRVLDSLGFVFQDANLLPWRTVAHNIALPLEVLRVPKAQRVARATELARSVGLEKFLDHLPKALSGGMRQRAAIMRALAANPDVLLMDEPFGALDALTRDDMNLMLQDIWLREKKTVVLVTHSITEAAFLADRVVVLTPHPGRIQRIVEVPFPRRRAIADTKQPAYQELIALLRREIGEEGD